MSSTIRTYERELRNLSGMEGESLSEVFGVKMGHFSRYTFPRLFQEQVAGGGARPAVLSGADGLSYDELNARANQLAGYLRARGAGANSIVGVCIDRSLDMVISILGILKSGAAYLPLDPDYPRERLAWMVGDSNAALIVTTSVLAPGLPASSAQTILLDVERAAIAEYPEDDLVDSPTPDDLAYVIYTSGSTGQPKGVMINHAALANYVLALHQELQINETDRYLHTASIAFSSSRRQLLLPLSRGAMVVVAGSDERKDPVALFEMVKRNAVTVMDGVPSFWRNCTAVLRSLDGKSRGQLLDNNLRLMLSASEPLLSDIPHTWIHEFGHRARHVHMFGQTETAGIVCVNHISGADDELISVPRLVPIGRPIANTEIYILDEHQERVPLGEAGELYIGGAGIGRGYLNRPELTAEKFLKHPFSAAPGARLYRTGDWARLRSDGLLEFAGRRDSQVKVRGFRIELSEVEATLARHCGVNEAAVVARPDRSGAIRLIAYVVAHESAASVTELRAFMAANVPDYMVPSTFVQLEALPLNVNGKVDRLALPEPETLRPQLTTPYQAPATSAERLLADIWSQVLQIDDIGVDDNFFELGGHSLLATQVVARVNKQLSTVVPLRDLFDDPTIRGLASKVIKGSAGARRVITRAQPAERDEGIPLSFAQQRLWFIDQLEPGSSLYNINRALRLRGSLDLVRLEQAVQLIAARHEILRTNFVATDGKPLQRSSSSGSLPFQFHDLESLPVDGRETAAREIVATESQRPFDLANGPLARISVIRLADDQYVLLLTIHHIIADAWTVTIFFRELSALYRNPVAEALPELPLQYGDYALWQRESVAGDALSAQLDYWRNQLGGAPPAFQLPTDFPRPIEPTSRGARHAISIPAGLSEALKNVGREEGATLFMILLAAFQVLLAQYSGHDELSVGIPVAGRTLVETEGMIGCFINTLVMRADLSRNPTLRDVIKRTREIALGAFTNQEVPFERLVEELRPERSLHANPLFEVMFSLQKEGPGDLTLPGIQLLDLPLELSQSKFDLSLDVVEKAEGLDISLSYSLELFDPGSVKSMLRDLEALLEIIATDRAKNLADLPAPEWTPRLQLVEPVEVNVEQQAEGFVAPRTPIEERLAAIWRDVLKVDRVGVHDNFFRLGGHSLLAAQVVSRVRINFAVEVPLRRIFETPTVAGMSEAIYDTQTNETEDDELAAMLAELSELSDEEAEQQFAEEF